MVFVPFVRQAETYGLAAYLLGRGRMANGAESS